VISSETAGLDIIGADFVREIQPVEIVIVDKEHGLRSERVELEGSRPALCIFEFIYFARPDSTMAGRTLHLVRQEMGKHLALEAPVEADLVIPVPDTGMPAAIGYASASGIPYAEGLIKNRYVHRTFIQPDDQLRQVGIRMKLNPLTAVIRGKRLVVVDDSIVRGNTTSKLVEMLFSAGAKEVHLRISSPPIQYPCYYGIDMATRAELIAANKTVDEIRDHVGATSVHYLTLDGLQASTGLPRSQFCRACFDGDYPIAVPEEYAMCKMRFEKDAATLCDP
jgi:amidophosphoribosyltransferase